ncbi:MAG: hypothetical protein QXJ68_03355 [Methanocellales archaeon]
MKLHPAEFITLKQFQGGFGWHNKLASEVKRKYRAKIDSIDEYLARDIAVKMNGELIEERIYPTVRWTIVLNPIRKLRIVFLYDDNEEFGKNLYFFFGREARDEIPTEDVAVFTQCYLSVISRYKEYLLSKSGDSGKLISVYELEKQRGEAFARYYIGERKFLMKHIKSEIAEKAAREIKAEFYRDNEFFKDGETWRIKVSPLFDLCIVYALKSSGDIDVLISEAAANKYLTGIFMGFTWLYGTEFIRAAQRLDPSIPKLSRYI